MNTLLKLASARTVVRKLGAATQQLEGVTAPLVSHLDGYVASRNGKVLPEGPL